MLSTSNSGSQQDSSRLSNHRDLPAVNQPQVTAPSPTTLQSPRCADGKGAPEVPRQKMIGTGCSRVLPAPATIDTGLQPPEDTLSHSVQRPPAPLESEPSKPPQPVSKPTDAPVVDGQTDRVSQQTPSPVEGDVPEPRNLPVVDTATGSRPS